MPVAVTTTLQSGADTATASQIETGITVDGKVGWEIIGMQCYWTNGEAVAAADYELQIGVRTDATGLNFADLDEIIRTTWAVQNTAGVAVALPLENMKEIILLEPRVTVAPILYVRAESANTAQANNIITRLYYNIIKLTDLEVLRLSQAGG